MRLENGSGLARAFFTFAGLVGAAMCSACWCGSHEASRRGVDELCAPRLFRPSGVSRYQLQESDAWELESPIPSVTLLGLEADAQTLQRARTGSAGAGSLTRNQTI